MTASSSAAGSGEVIRFGVFELDVSAGELRKRGLRLPIQGIPLQILAILARRPGEVVTRDELRAQLWPADTFVDFDHSIRNAIARLRESLGDSADTPRYIETLPRRGYRFIGQVEPLAATSAAKEVAPAPGPRSSRLRFFVPLAVVLVVVALGWFAYLRSGRGAAPHIQSLVVIPFDNLTGKPDQEYFVDGMTDELISGLAKIRSLRVVSRTSSMRYKKTSESLQKIAQELNVDAIVEGTVSRSGNRVRIRVQLIDARTDRHLWAENYDRQLGDVVTLENDIARTVAGEIRAQLTPAEQVEMSRQRPVNPEAYEDYLKGRFHWNRRTEKELRAGIEYFNQAIVADPQYALAYVGLADSYNILGSWVFTAVPSGEAQTKATLYAGKALALDDTLGEAHASLAVGKHVYDWDWQGGEAEYQRAIALRPNYADAHHWHGELLLDLGQIREAVEESRKAKELDPLSPIVTAALAERLCAAGQMEEALREARSALELDPNHPLAHKYLGEIYAQQHKYPQAIVEFKSAVQLSNSNPNYVVDLGYTYAVSGDRENALAILKDLQAAARTRYVPQYVFAVVFAGLGEKRQALAALEKAYQEHSPWMVNAARDNRLDSLRTEPAFVQLMKTLRFPQSDQKATP